MCFQRLFTGMLLGLSLAGALAGQNPPAQSSPTQGIRESITGSQPILWIKPDEIATRDLLYGPGEKANAPEQSSFVFIEEDRDGTSPKFNVRDSDGRVWKVKLGREAKPETVATRFVWAIGYHADEDYFVERATIAEMPVRLKRGQNLVKPGGAISDARFERVRVGSKKKGEWRWKQNQYSGTRELNGLRVVMALVNNWDLKDSNNTVLETPDEANAGLLQILYVSDLGGTFGSAGFAWPASKAKGNLKEFSSSKFINRISDDFVDFKAPARPALLRIVALPHFISRLKMRWIGRRIPIEDVRWASHLLSQLSAKQIRDAFRGAGYAADEVEAYARVIESRIAELQKL